ncbi:MAG: TRAP transporter large permease subunit, partial [Euryarchaeota archaeon]|nr:TRAP transporter large permease subunit [Euryarchaeota archaeon]
LMAELALITPPVGMNLYVIHSIRGPGHSISDVIVGVIPFLFMMVAVTAILIFFPGIALWLPGILYD